ncbi:MAG: hypothetical protein GX100_06105 [candidate division WS1 bacterium]|jgi:hypothetical protein|nr:hypothetical protein [candidate division WS1 bacterium]
MNTDWEQASALEVVATVIQHLRSHGIEATLVGGACVSIYSHNRYQSSDLDLVTAASLKQLASALAELGFDRIGRGREFRRQDCGFYLDFLHPPVAVGGEAVETAQVVHTEWGALPLLTPTDCIKDRLAAYYHWSDPQSLEQAVMIARAQAAQVDLAELERWSKREGHLKKFQVFRIKLED